MICPLCGKHATLENNVKGISTAAGIGAGGYLAANSGAAGATIGSLNHVCFYAALIVGGKLYVIFNKIRKQKKEEETSEH